VQSLVFQLLCYRTLESESMPYVLKFGKLPVGRALSGARKKGETVTVQYIEFTSTEDGQQFIKALEGFPDDILKLLAHQCGVTVPPSCIDNMLAIINRDQTATVYLNELRQILTVRASRAIRTGEPVAKNDIADIHKMELHGIDIPPDSGVVFLFSVGWRKGLFWDFGPLNPTAPANRSFDCSAVFAQLYAHVLFQERFSILESEWDSLFRVRFFPFAGVKNETVESVLSYLRAGWGISDLTNTIIAEVRQRLPGFVESWRAHPVFQPHIVILERAVERFNNSDYISCVALLLPRIEGILRSHHVDIAFGKGLGQSNLAESAVASSITAEKCLLLPAKFKDYIQKVYFAGFDSTVAPCDQSIAISRHSVAHGVASPDAFTPMAAATSFLVLHQLFYCFEPVSK
jgi:hypothetical protein